MEIHRKRQVVLLTCLICSLSLAVDPVPGGGVAATAEHVQVVLDPEQRLHHAILRLGVAAAERAQRLNFEQPLAAGGRQGVGGGYPAWGWAVWTQHPAQQVLAGDGFVAVAASLEYRARGTHELPRGASNLVAAIAAAGGFTAVCAMPDTAPVNDNRQVTEFILRKAKEAGAARVYPVGAISCNLSGTSLAEYGELMDAGAVAVTDDGLPVKNALFMRRALEYAGGLDIPVISHCEELNLAAGGSMNEGQRATELGIKGIPNVSESVMVTRDIALAELTGARVHFCHMSTAQSIDAKGVQACQCLQQAGMDIRLKA